MKMNILIWFLIILSSLTPGNALFDNLFTGIRSYFHNEGPMEDYQEEMYNQKIPYEVSTTDEKFLSEAAKLTGVALTDLDSCQQRVVLKLKSDCDKMDDEQLAKMAVHLLNCQSFVEGRQIYPCSDDMSIRECTTNMDSDTWTSYHLMSNRARAVCYTIRQSQFRGLAEHTVNRLMEAARGQLKNLNRISDTQLSLQGLAEKTYDKLSEGHESLSKQQQDIQKAQFYGQLAIEDNIKRLTDEKRLILETHNQLVEMTKNIQGQLENSLIQLNDQSGETKLNHQQLIEDLMTIQDKTTEIFEKIDKTSSLLFAQNEEFGRQYQSTLRSLQEMNETVHNLAALVGGTWRTLEDRLVWITSALGGTDHSIERIYLVLWHSTFILLAMLSCAFMGVRTSTRLVVATLPPLNLAVAFYGEQKHLDFVGLLSTILIFVVVQFIILGAFDLKNKRKKEAISWEESTSPIKTKESIATSDNVGSSTNDKVTSTLYNSESTVNGYSAVPLRLYEDDYGHENSDTFRDFDFTPPISRNGHYPTSSRSRSRSRTPLLLNTSIRSPCRAKTRQGTPCKLISQPGRDFCFRHQTGESVIG
ncbi:protein brambleberry [Leptinotarsa decemlineata]|uniref:protein brambleberry n=1 Tax=Leptinotarsa decemlineata TaxID=7539 RepID=UPI000C251CB4|nr:protein brambleberry-like [Leptinotarsa decemlineata]